MNSASVSCKAHNGSTVTTCTPLPVSSPKHAGAVSHLHDSSRDPGRFRGEQGDGAGRRRDGGSTCFALVASLTSLGSQRSQLSGACLLGVITRTFDWYSYTKTRAWEEISGTATALRCVTGAKGSAVLRLAPTLNLTGSLAMNKTTVENKKRKQIPTTLVSRVRKALGRCLFLSKSTTPW